VKIRIGRLLALLGTGVFAAVGAFAIIQRSGAGEIFRGNRRCCELSFMRNVQVTVNEVSGRQRYFGEIGQDKWVLERVFPGVTNGYFVDIGSGHGTIGSNSRALEQRGWSGVCVDPFPIHMEGRTCKMFKEVVFSKPGLLMTFHTAGGLGGVDETLGEWNKTAASAPTVTVKTVTLDDLLARAGAPQFIQFVSLDIEGAELEALLGFPFDRYHVGAWTIEHNREEPKRSRIAALLGQHGYRRVHEWRQDDFFVGVDGPY
jgi:FkbM family methyltransferase